MSPEPIRIFVGADRSQQLARQVLEYSIRRHASQAVEFRAIDNGMVPEVADPCNAPYTNFSFARFHIPALCDFRGRAVYMDSDMLVFRDIAELWDTPFHGARVLLECGSLEKEGGAKQAAVLLLDCSRLDWDASNIVARLGQDYNYNQLMSLSPLVTPQEIAQRIPNGWNDLDHFDAASTRNLHYTEIRTQPWVHAGHPHGGLWVAELGRMLSEGALSPSDVQSEVDAGYARPSLLLELGINSSSSARHSATDLQQFDASQGFVAHRELLARFARRKLAIAQYKRDLAVRKTPWLAPVFDLQLWVKKRQYASRAQQAA